jgi:O-antigen ligase
MTFSDFKKKSYSFINLVKKYFDQFIFCIVFFYAFTPFISKSANSVFEIFLGIFLFYLFVKNPKYFRKDFMTKIFIMLILFQIVTWVSVKMSRPDLAYALPKIDRLGKLFLFIPVAWGLRKKTLSINLIFITVLAGFIIALFVHSNFLSEIKSAIHGRRIDFGIKNAQHTSMVFGIFLMFSFYKLVFIESFKKYNQIILNFTILLFSLAGLISTQTRQTFVALFISFLFTFAFIFILKIVKKRNLIMLFFLSIFLLSVLFKLGNLDKRFEETDKSFDILVSSLIEGKKFDTFDDRINFYIKELPNTGTGIRLKTWFVALPWIVEKPVLGWGSEARTFVIKNSEVLPKSIVKKFGHLHNYHIEIILSYGFVGFVLIWSFYIWLVGSLYKIRDCLRENNDLYVIVIAFAFVIYWLVVNCFESLNSFWTGVFMNNIVCGCIYSKYLYYKINKEF